jgi:hypothetical protein
MKKSSNSVLRVDQFVIISAIAIFVAAPILLAKSSNLKIIRENRRYYVLFPDSNKVEIVKAHEGGAENIAVLSTDAKYVFYTDCNWLGFESSGKDLFYCKPDGSERTFLHKLEGYVGYVEWLKKNGHNYLLFVEGIAGAETATIDLFDFDQRMMLLKMKGWDFERMKTGDCFILKDQSGNLMTDSKICLDSLLLRSDPDKYNVSVYKGYANPHFLFLSTRKEAFLDPQFSLIYVSDEKDFGALYGGLGHCFISPFKRYSVFCINLESKSWVGVLNHDTNKFQYMDSMNIGKYNYNFVWSDKENLLGFIKISPENYKEMVVLKFLGDSSSVVIKSIRFDEENEIELVGWSNLKKGFYYIMGKKEFLKLGE